MSLGTWLRQGLLLATLALGAAACAPIVPVPYEPQPGRIAKPKEEIKTIILANTVQGCMSEVEASERIIAVKYACAAGSYGGIGNSVIRLEEIDNIELQQRGEWYRVLVHHKGAPEFAWTSKSLTDMQRMADAITALSRHAK
jgi:hypothetical protein